MAITTSYNAIGLAGWQELHCCANLSLVPPERHRTLTIAAPPISLDPLLAGRGSRKTVSAIEIRADGW